MGGLLLRGRGRLTRAAHRQKAIELIGEANAAGAGLASACRQIGICPRTLKRWQNAFGGDGNGKDRRKCSPCLLIHRLSEEERQRNLLTCNQPKYVSLPPGQIVPSLADQVLFIGSESSFYRVLHQAGRIDPMRSGRGTSPIYRPRCGVCGCISTWWSMSGAAYLALGQRAGGTRWWHGMWLRWSQPISRLSWCSGLASMSAIATPGVSGPTSPPQQSLILHAGNGNA